MLPRLLPLLPRSCTIALASIPLARRLPFTRFSLTPKHTCSSFRPIKLLQRPSHPFINSHRLFTSERDSPSLEEIRQLQKELLKPELSEQQSKTKESAARNISIQLMSVENASQVLDLFERQILKNPTLDKREIFGQELAILLFYVAKNLDTLSLRDGRVLLLLDMLYNRFSALDFDYKASALWAMHVLSEIGLEVPLDSRLILLSELPPTPPDDFPDIPTLLLSVATLFQFDSPLPEPALEFIRNYSLHYIEVLSGFENVRPIDLHSVLQSWAKLRLNDPELLARAKPAVMEEDLFEQGSEADLRGVILAAGTLRWKDQEVLAHLLYCFNLVKETYELPSLISIFYSLAMVSQSPEAFTLLAREIAAQLDNIEQVKNTLDITSYLHLWLGAACFDVKMESNEDLKALVLRLVRYLNVNTSWQAQHLSASELATLVLSANLLGVRMLKFNQLLAELVRRKVDEFTIGELLNVAGSGIFEELSQTQDALVMVRRRCRDLEGEMTVDQKRAWERVQQQEGSV